MYMYLFNHMVFLFKTSRSIIKDRSRFLGLFWKEKKNREKLYMPDLDIWARLFKTSFAERAR